MAIKTRILKQVMAKDFHSSDLKIFIKWVGLGQGQPALGDPTFNYNN